MVFVSVAVRPERSAIAVCSITVAALLSRPAARMPSTSFRRRTTGAFIFLDSLDTEFASCYYLDASRYTVDNNTLGGGCAQLETEFGSHPRGAVASLSRRRDCPAVASCFMREVPMVCGRSLSSAVGPSGVLSHDLDSFR